MPPVAKADPGRPVSAPARTAVSPDAGSAGLGALAAAAVVLAATLVALTWAGAVTARQRAESAADLSALAGAQASVRGGDACRAAAAVAAASAARLPECVAEGDGSVRVLTDVSWAPTWTRGLGLLPARARARAGPPDARLP